MPSEIINQNTVSAPIQRGWMPYKQAARLYLGISEDVLLAGIKRHELPAYEKPITRERTGTKQYHSYFVNLADVDQWIRTYWQPYSA